MHFRFVRSNILAKDREPRGQMIEGFVVKNYRSLKSVQIALRPLTAFVGPNASGKSNILGAMALMAGIVSGTNLAELMDRKGGYESCVWGGDSRADIELEASGYLSRESAASKERFKYGVVLRGTPGLAIRNEWVDTSTPEMRLRRSGDRR